MESCRQRSNSFGAAQFVIGYYDRVIRSQVNVPLERIRLRAGRSFRIRGGGRGRHDPHRTLSPRAERVAQRRTDLAP